MNIMDLEEFEGLTVEMVRAAAEARGFTYRSTSLYSPNGGVALFFAVNPHCLGAVVRKLAEHAGLSIQAILREMNPRMRKGLPSAESRAAHEGPWIAETVSGSLIVGIFMEHLVMGLVLDCFGMTLRPLSDWSFWPCDAHGNKVRWPSLAGGEGRR